MGWPACLFTLPLFEDPKGLSLPPSPLLSSPLRTARLTLVVVRSLTLQRYYEECDEANETTSVLTMMRDAYIDTFSPKVSSSWSMSTNSWSTNASMKRISSNTAAAKLIEWGRDIRVKFDFDNLQLIDKKKHGGHEQVIHVVKQLGSSVASMQVQVAEVAASQLRIESKLDAILSRLPASQHSIASPSPAPHAPPKSPAAAKAAASAASAASISSAPRAVPQPTPMPLVHSSSRPSPPASELANLDKEYVTAKRLSGQFFLDCLKLGGRLPHCVEKDSRRRKHAQMVFDTYKAMATEEEMAVLRDPERDEAVAIRYVKNVCSMSLTPEPLSLHLIPCLPHLISHLLLLPPCLLLSSRSFCSSAFSSRLRPTPSPILQAWLQVLSTSTR